MRMTKSIRAPDGARHLHAAVERSQGTITLNARRISPEPEESKETVLSLTMVRPSDAERWKLAIFGAKASGKIDEVESIELLDATEAVRCALVSEAVSTVVKLSKQVRNRA